MFSYIRHGWIGKNILGLLILVFLNSSIDAPDIFSKSVAYNEQETLIELIVEKGLGFEEAISEQEHDNELPENSASKKFQTDLFRTQFSESLFDFNFDLKNQSSPCYLNLIYSQDHSKIIIPPPEFRV